MKLFVLSLPPKRLIFYFLFVMMTLSSGICVAQKTWTGNGGDGLWNTASNWSGNAVPVSTDQVLFDNSGLAGSYSVTLPSGAVNVTIARLTIKPTTGNTITVTLPAGNTADPGFTIGDAYTNSTDILIYTGGILKNSSGAATGNGITLTIQYEEMALIGGTYIHNTLRSPSGVMKTDLPSFGGTFEYDVPGTSPYTIYSVESYGNINIVLTRSAGPATYNFAGSFLAFGGLTVNTGVTFNITMSAGGYFQMQKNEIINNGNALTLPDIVFQGQTGTMGGSGSVTFSNITIYAGCKFTMGANISIPSSKTLTVNTNGILDCGIYNVTGAGAFILQSGGKLNIGSVNGLSSTGATGNIQVTGTRNYSSGAYYEFNGTSAQVTGNSVTATVAKLIINNTAGVTLSNSFDVSTSATVNANAQLICGTNNITGAGTFTLNSGATLSLGSTAGISSTAGSGNIQVTGTRSFSTTANYIYAGTNTGQSTGDQLPSTVNDLTFNVITGGPPTANNTLTSSTTVNGTLALTKGKLTVGANTLTLNGPAITGTTTNLTTSVSSSLVFGGSSAGIVIPSSVTSLTGLTINNPNGVTCNSAIQASNWAIGTGGVLNAGTFTHKILGTWSNSGTLNASTGKFILQNNADKTLTGATTFYDLEMNSTVAKATMLSDITVTHTLTLTAGPFVIGANTLTLNGSVVNTSGYLRGSSASNLVIGGSAGTLSFDQASAAVRSLNNLTLSNSSASATLGGAMDIYGNIKLNDGTLTINAQNLTLKSNASGTATIDQLNSTGSNLVGGTNVTVERWIPLRQGIAAGGRAYRTLGSTVTTTGSIRANWMEGGMNTAIGTNSDPVPTFGTQISGLNGNANGFDKTQTNAASLYTFINGSNINGTLGYAAVTSTSGTLDAKKGYFLYIRGDRSTSMQVPYSPTGGMPTSSTALRATGAIQKGAISFTISNTAGDFSMITNPYPSPLDWFSVYSANSNISTSYTVWDPNSGIRGAFITVDNTGTPNQTSAAGRYIQPGSAFFVQSNGGSPTVNLAESMKAVGNNSNGVFRMQTAFESFSAELFLTESNGIRHSADGIMVKYDDSFSRSKDAFDTDEIPNWDENIAINRNGTMLGTEARPVIIETDTIPLFIKNMRKTDYEFEFTPSHFSNAGLKAELIDNYLHTRILLSVVSKTTVAFTINADEASFAADRFMIVFNALSSPLPIDAMVIKATRKNNGVYVEWSARTETDMDRYEVERSSDGTTFSKIAIVAAIGNSSSTVEYNWFDATPSYGDNFYRVKAIDRAGGLKYTAVVKVNIMKESRGISVFPNPVTDKHFSVNLDRMDKGNYKLSLFNDLGQRAYYTQFDHTGGNTARSFLLNKDFMAGVYRLVIEDDNGKKLTEPLVIE